MLITNCYKKYCSDILMSQNAAWLKVLNKVAFGIDNCDLGKVQQVGPDIIMTEKGFVNKKKIFHTKEFDCRL